MTRNKIGNLYLSRTVLHSGNSCQILSLPPFPGWHWCSRSCWSTSGWLIPCTLPSLFGFMITKFDWNHWVWCILSFSPSFWGFRWWPSLSVSDYPLFLSIHRSTFLSLSVDFYIFCLAPDYRIPIFLSVYLPVFLSLSFSFCLSPFFRQRPQRDDVL